ncbi:urease accessory protein UreE [Candidatus Nitrososphaera gargensis Ga9.2]|uniref:Urease accessory protein UreE n=1 Tax=Nitrososphaera gargensis (strain Ga9.2) TaxID=1237085 RepID=K0IM50_NITGG|nr:urease accessory protein UreE [Candidatus Nitrososphaera gargensis]AFU57559.1 urease accessory protein UreE [Candidatus Nitrososphaera gargensis Ga9.2]
MITVDSIIGNIYRDKSLGKKYDEMLSKSQAESVRINRIESQRVRMRKTSNKGTDIALTLPSGTKLRHGDILLNTSNQMIVIELEPENVISLEIKKNLHDDDDHVVQIPARIGHAIGNLHRPLKLQGRTIYFPIQAESEVEMFRKIFSPLEDHLEIKSMKMVFEPDEGMDVHEH